MKVVKEAVDVLDFQFGLAYNLILGDEKELEEFIKTNITEYAELVGNLEKYTQPGFAREYVKAEVEAQVSKNTYSVYTSEIFLETMDYLHRYRKMFPTVINGIITERAVDLVLRLVNIYFGKGIEPCEYDVKILNLFIELVDSIYTERDKDMHTREVFDALKKRVYYMV